MTDGVQFHFVLLAAGEVLKHDRFVDAQKIQDYIVQDDAFGGIRIPLEECRLALQLLESSGFIMAAIGHEGEYERATLLMVYDKWK